MGNGSTRKFIIIGVGPGGAVMANYLGQAGCEVEVYEKRPDIRHAKIAAGRSINLALSVRGIHALREIGVIDDVMRDAIAMRGRVIHDPAGKLSYQPYGVREDQAINSVSRAGLNVTLLNAAECHPKVKLFFNCKCVGVDLDAVAVELACDENGKRVTAGGDIIIGADGAFSAVRARMQRLDRFDFSQQYLAHGYKELTIPPGPDGGFLMEKNALHIWPRRSYMMIALPNADGSYTCTCFWPFSGLNGFDRLTTSGEVRAYFSEHFPDAIGHMPSLTEDFLRNPTSSLVTIRCCPWHYQDKVVLLGDAAHAVVPFYGQGMNAAFEDCTVLNECLQACGGDCGSALREYDRRRKENADAIADLALANFVEMRDHVGSPAFLRKKQRERRLHRLFPKRYVPLYTMVTFTRVPYAEAVRRAARQDRTVRALTLLAGLLLVTIMVCLVFLVT